MSANVYGNRLAHAGEGAWWGQGTQIVDPRTKASEALQMAGADYPVEKRQLFYTSRQTGLTMPTARVALVRPSWMNTPEQVLGYASDRYEPLQNTELAELLDPLVAEWPVETVLALGDGETLAMTLNAGMATVGGDDIQLYYFAANSHDGMSAVKINLTPIRVVCSNTFIMGLREATVTADIRHTRRVLTDTRFAVELVAKMRKAQEASIEGLRRLTKIHVTMDQVSRLAEIVYPDKTASAKLAQLDAHERGEVQLSDEQLAHLMDVKANGESARERAMALRLAFFESLLMFSQERPAYAGTAWAAWNAATQLASHREGGSDLKVATSILTGERGREMALAYRELMKLA